MSEETTAPNTPEDCSADTHDWIDDGEDWVQSYGQWDDPSVFTLVKRSHCRLCVSGGKISCCWLIIFSASTPSDIARR